MDHGHGLGHLKEEIHSFRKKYFFILAIEALLICCHFLFIQKPFIYLLSLFILSTLLVISVFNFFIELRKYQKIFNHAYQKNKVFLFIILYFIAPLFPIIALYMIGKPVFSKTAKNLSFYKELSKSIFVSFLIGAIYGFTSHEFNANFWKAQIGIIPKYSFNIYQESMSLFNIKDRINESIPNCPIKVEDISKCTKTLLDNDIETSHLSISGSFLAVAVDGMYFNNLNKNNILSPEKRALSMVENSIDYMNFKKIKTPLEMNLGPTFFSPLDIIPVLILHTLDLVVHYNYDSMAIAKFDLLLKKIDDNKKTNEIESIDQKVQYEKVKDVKDELTRLKKESIYYQLNNL